MGQTTLRIERLDGGLLVIEAGPLATAFFEAPRAIEFEQVAGTTWRNGITSEDIGLLNGLMGARTPHRLWKPILDRRLGWLHRIDEQVDLVRTSERTWRAVDGDRLVREALVGCVGPDRNIAVATKLLHLKRPRLFPILDRLIVELLGGRVSVTAEAADRARDAADLVLHLRTEGKANRGALREVRRRLRAKGTDVSPVRILDAVLWSSHPSRGFSQHDAGRMVGRSERTIRAWLHDVDGFREAARAVQAEASEPTALDTLRLALRATRKDGSADWSIRVQAARTLLRALPKPEEAAAERTFVQVVIQPDGTIVDPGRVIEPAEPEPHPDREPEPVAPF
jgi:hypothetical protein